MVLQPARAGDHDIDALTELFDLRLGPYAAENGHRPQVRCGGQWRQRRFDLRDEFAGGRQYECTGPARNPLLGIRCESRHQGQQEGIGLARSGPATPEHISAGKGIRQRRCLDGERGLDAFVGEYGDDRRCQAEVGECGRG
jgi:hypothetical protein